jgi:hypothetical protein
MDGATKFVKGDAIAGLDAVACARIEASSSKATPGGSDRRGAAT